MMTWEMCDLNRITPLGSFMILLGMFITFGLGFLRGRKIGREEMRP